MGRLLPRHERFCQSFVECANPAAAARAAGYPAERARNAGYRLLRHPRIAERIAAVHAEIGRAACRNVDVFLGKLETVYRRSVDEHRFSAAARAVELQARPSGLARRIDEEDDRIDWNRSIAAPSNGTDLRKGIPPGDITLNRSRPHPVNDN